MSDEREEPATEQEQGEEKMVEETVQKVNEESDRPVRILAERAEKAMNYLQLAVAYILLILFAVAVYDLALMLFEHFVTGQIFEPVNVISILETALLLFLIVEVFRTSVAHLEGLAVLPLVIDVAIIGVARSLITYRVEAYASKMDALLAGASYSLILLVLVGAFYIVHRQKRKELEHHKAEDGEDD
ncbi:MAG: phosphate-starvation-inducible PsiE family protein [Candidatus Nanosalina sp.]